MLSEKHLFEGEKICQTFSQQQLVLTNYRLRHFSSVSKNEKISSVMLDSIGSMDLAFKRHWEFLALGCLFIFMAGLSQFLQLGEIPLIFLFVGLVMVLAFLFTRKTTLTIYCIGGGKIIISAKEFRKEKYLEIVQHIEKAIVDKKKNPPQKFTKSDFY